MSLITVYWVGSWQSESDPFLMLSGTVLVFFLPCVMLINSTLYFLSRKVFKKDLSLYLFPFFWVTGEYLLTLTDLKFPWLTIGHGLAEFTSFIQIADIIGAFGLSFVVLWINIFIYKGIKSFKVNSKDRINSPIYWCINIHINNYLWICKNFLWYIMIQKK